MRFPSILALATSVALASLSTGNSRAQEPDEPPLIDKPDFSKPPTPKSTEPIPPDGGPNAYIRTPDEVIAFFEERTRRVPKDFVSYHYLGEAFERKARAHDDLSCYEKAEKAFRRSLEIMPGYSRSEAGLASVLCTRHKFAEGLEIARKLFEREPKNIDALATIGDAQLELGRYQEAESTFASLYKLAPIPEVVARQAHLAELTGHLDQALDLMQRAANDARKASTPQDSAWYFVTVADVMLQVGRISEAEKRYLEVLKDVPEQHDATFGLGMVYWSQGKHDQALGWIERAVAIGPDPHMLIALGDICLETNRPVEAEAQFNRLEKLTRGQSEYLRSRALFLADHDRDLAEALRLAEEDFSQRKDVHGYDTLAWTLFKNERFAEASKASAEAVKLGTPDPKLYYHSGLIKLKLGDKDGARRDLKKALDLNPQFAPIHAERARKAMSALN